MIRCYAGKLSAFYKIDIWLIFNFLLLGLVKNISTKWSSNNYFCLQTIQSYSYIKKYWRILAADISWIHGSTSSWSIVVFYKLNLILPTFSFPMANVFWWHCSPDSRLHFLDTCLDAASIFTYLIYVLAIFCSVEPRYQFQRYQSSILREISRAQTSELEAENVLMIILTLW